MNQTTQKPIQTLQELAQNLRSDRYYFVSPCSAGDLWRLCTLKPALEQKYNGNIIIIIKSAHEAVCEMFEGLEYIICEDKSVDFCKDRHCLMLDNIVSLPTRGKIYSHFVNYEIIIGFVNNQLDLDRVRYMLPKDAQRILPTNLPKLSESLREKLTKITPLDKIFLLCPEANSFPKLSPIIFKYECQRLRKQGYSIVVNALKYKQEYAKFFIDGVYDLNLSLKDAIALALHCAGVISTRSGFCDIIAPHCNFLKIYYTNFEPYILWDNYMESKSLERVYIEDMPIYKVFLRYTSESLPMRLYKRYATKGFLRKLRTPFTLYFKIYKRQRCGESSQGFSCDFSQDFERESICEFVQNELAQTYEYQLGLALQRACERFWCGGFLMFPLAYAKIRAKKGKELVRMNNAI